MWKKILGTGGAVLSVGATLFHAIDSSQLPPKWSVPFTILGTLLALWGKHPGENTIPDPNKA